MPRTTETEIVTEPLAPAIEADVYRVELPGPILNIADPKPQTG